MAPLFAALLAHGFRKQSHTLPMLIPTRDPVRTRLDSTRLSPAAPSRSTPPTHAFGPIDPRQASDQGGSVGCHHSRPAISICHVWMMTPRLQRLTVFLSARTLHMLFPPPSAHAGGELGPRHRHPSDRQAAKVSPRAARLASGAPEGARQRRCCTRRTKREIMAVLCDGDDTLNEPQQRK